MDGLVGSSIGFVSDPYLELLQRLSVRLELSRDFSRVIVPIGPVAESSAEARVVACVVEVDDFSKNGHQR